ncbi:MAG: YfhO family protein, partial [Phycisphaerales bacterium]
NLLYAVLSVPHAVTLLVIVHMAAAGLFCFLLARELKLTGFASLVSGIIFMFNGFLISRAYRGQSERLEALAFLPLIFFLLERGERRGQLRWFLWAGLAGALQILAGAPQIAWLTWVGAGLYAVVRRLSRWQAGSGRALARTVVGLLMAVGFTAGLAAVQILPTAELAGLSNRSEASIEFSSAYAFLPLRVIHLLYPSYFLHPPAEYFNVEAECSGYVGLMGLVLAIVGLFRYRSRVRWALLAVMLLSLCIMLGRATPMFGLLYHMLPGLGSFRIPSRAILMLTLCLSLLAGMGADAMWRRSHVTRTRWFGVFTAGTVFLTMALLAYDLRRFTEGGLVGTTVLWSGLLFAAVALAAVSAAWLPRRKWVQGAWLLVIAADLTFVGATMKNYRDFETRLFCPPASESDVIEQLRGDGGLYRFALPRRIVRENCGVLAGQSGVNAFISLSLERYYNFVHYMTWQRRPPLETHTPAADVFSPDNPFPFKILNVRYGVGRDPQTGEECLIERDDYLPRAYFLPRWRTLDNEDAVLEAMRRADFDPRDVVLFDQDPGVDFASSGGGGEVSVTTYSPKRIVLEADVASDGFLVLSEMHYPGWHAYVDDNEVPVLRVDYLLRAVPLRAGRYDKIEVRYEPRSVTIGFVITAISAAALVATFLVVARRSRGVRPIDLQGASSSNDAGETGRAWSGVQMAVVLAAFLWVPVSLQSDYAACWANIGYYFAEQGEAKQAEAAMTQALRRAPDSYAVNLWTGRALRKLGRYEEAVERLHVAARKEPGIAEVYNSLGTLLVVTGDLESGLEHLRHARELSPDDSRASYNLGIALMRGGRYDQTADCLDEAFRIAPGDAKLHLEAARLWAMHDQNARAIAVLRQGLARRPYNPELLDALAWQLATCRVDAFRDGPEAVRLAEQACGQTGHRDPYMLQTLAAAHAECGDLDRATEIAQQARSLAVPSEDANLMRQLDAMLRDFIRRGGGEPAQPEEPLPGRPGSDAGSG